VLNQNDEVPEQQANPTITKVLNAFIADASYASLIIDWSLIDVAGQGRGDLTGGSFIAVSDQVLPFLPAAFKEALEDLSGFLYMNLIFRYK
jgi:hypothetical protein